MLKIELDFPRAPIVQTILIEPGLCSDWRSEVERRTEGHAFLALIDANVARKYRLPPTGESYGKWRYLHVRPGDNNKTLSQYVDLVNAALAFDLPPDTVVAAVGGGVTIDLAGVLAASVNRNFRFVAIPTSLLAQVDPAIGGECGVNSRHGKNALGLVYPPEFVLIDSGFVEKLPPDDYRQGLAEVVRTAVTDSVDFFEEVRTSTDLLAVGNPGIVSGVVAHCSRVKSGLLAKYPQKREEYLPALSVGRIFARLLEVLAGFAGTVRHGEAVAVGLALACDFSTSRGMLSRRDAEDIKELLFRFRLPCDVMQLGVGRSNPPDWKSLLSSQAISRILTADNRVHNARLRLALPITIGDTRFVDNIPLADLCTFLRKT